MRYQITGDDGTFTAYLEGVCKTLTEALNNEKRNVQGHVPHPQFECAFSDGDEPQANAMLMDGVSVVWITKGLLAFIWTACDLLSKSEHVVQLFNHAPTNQIHATLFQTQLSFILCHEYAHHVHGHLEQASFRLEAGDIQTQVFEVDADCYAIYFVLAFLINGAGRAEAVGRLNCAQANGDAQDQALLASFVLAISGFLYATPPVPLDPARPFQRRYPPLAARMNWIMESAMDWCDQIKPHLKEWMTGDKFRELMFFAADAVAELNGGAHWGDQISFFKSEQGAAYAKAVMERFAEYKRSLYS
ncbi:MAG TPA: hypothetical protein VN861_14405 [Candidatus Acidoferrales bacterium]|nr:hypothetical protein [Candidatus Acidoferrales bacterium]